MSTLGIDFGTTNSSASYVDPSGRPKAVQFIGHDQKMPTLVSFYTGRRMFGYEAKYMLDNCYTLPREEQVKLQSSTAKSIKRELDIGGKIHGYSHREIIAMFMRHIKEQAEKACAPQQFDKLVLTHPVQFEEWKKQMLQDAAKQSGFSGVQLLEEPVSAALGYIKSEGAQDVRGMLIYDFGGGTFDVAYVINQDGKFVVPIPPKGDSHCGGDDIDKALYNYIIQKAKPVIGEEAFKGYFNRINLGLLIQCRKWKEMLTAMDNLPIQFTSNYQPNKTYQGWLERKELERICGDVVDKTIRLTKTVYDEVKANKLPLDFVLLIGGSSSIPLIRERLKQSMPDLEVRTTGTADTAVALGASYHAVNPVVVDPDNEWCYCMYDGKRILKTYNFCIYCGKPNFYKTGKV